MPLSSYGIYAVYILQCVQYIVGQLVRLCEKAQQKQNRMASRQLRPSPTPQKGLRLCARPRPRPRPSRRPEPRNRPQKPLPHAVIFARNCNCLGYWEIRKYFHFVMQFVATCFGRTDFTFIRRIYISNQAYYTTYTYSINTTQFSITSLLLRP